MNIQYKLYAMNKNILVTGGLGYIGSHVCVELTNDGFTPIILDNCCNSNPEVLDRLCQLTGKNEIIFYKGDIRDTALLNSIFENHSIDSVMHFAGLKAVGESTQNPLSYFQNNVEGTLCLIDTMGRNDVKNIIFSSSATVYSLGENPPFTEDTPTGKVTNPYGRTKFMVEEILKDLASANPKMAVTILRYFNPVGAHTSGLIGEDPMGTPNNLMPFIAKVAAGELSKLMIYGDDYNTHDGTGVRDYIHVVDLARGHVAALNKSAAGYTVYNLGTGKGHSVFQVLKAYESACGHAIPYEITARRAGDIDASYADATKANRELHWVATKTIDDAANDSWRWIIKTSKTE